MPQKYTKRITEIVDYIEKHYIPYKFTYQKIADHFGVQRQWISSIHRWHKNRDQREQWEREREQRIKERLENKNSLQKP